MVVVRKMGTNKHNLCGQKITVRTHRQLIIKM
jgi:hypothetical protein